MSHHHLLTESLDDQSDCYRSQITSHCSVSLIFITYYHNHVTVRLILDTFLGKQISFELPSPKKVICTVCLLSIHSNNLQKCPLRVCFKLPSKKAANFFWNVKYGTPLNRTQKQEQLLWSKVSMLWSDIWSYQVSHHNPNEDGETLLTSLEPSILCACLEDIVMAFCCCRLSNLFLLEPSSPALLDESVNWALACVCMYCILWTLQNLDCWMQTTETHPLCNIFEDEMWLPKKPLNCHICKNLTNAMTIRVPARQPRRKYHAYLLELVNRPAVCK